VVGTIGQPATDILSGGGYALRGGFWFGGGTSPVDVADEGDVAGSEAFRFKVQTAVPDPFMHSTLVAFGIPARRDVDIGVYDVSGRLRRKLHAAPLTAGRHQQAWDGRDDAGHRMAAGVYFIRVQAGPDRSAKKVVLMR
jgi:hypothetical protein